MPRLLFKATQHEQGIRVSSPKIELHSIPLNAFHGNESWPKNQEPIRKLKNIISNL